MENTMGNTRLAVAKSLEIYTGILAEEILSYFEAPQDIKLGDCAFPCFRLSKQLKKAPNVISQELKDKFTTLPEGVLKVEAVSGYLNFYFDRTGITKSVLEALIHGAMPLETGKGKTVVIDYSSPNIARPFHIGHLYSTLIGASLVNIYKFLGYDVVGINYLGDWGTQFGKLISAYLRWSSEEAVAKDGIRELLRVYVKFHQEAEDHPEQKLDDEGRHWLLKMEQGDETALKLWKWFRQISIEEYEKSYKRLGISFDSYNGESFYNDKMLPVVDELREKNLLEESDGAMVVRLEEYKMPPCLILRSDGGTLYPTRDIASAKYRKDTYNFHKSLYVTDARQALHFAQWFKVVGLMGYEYEKDMIHVPYGLLSLEEGTMSTRKGNFIFVDSVIDEAKDRAYKIIEEKNPNLANKEDIAEQVAIGAIFFSDLYNSRRKDVVFSLEKMVNFDGETGPYVQYTHARTCSVIEKAGNVPDTADYSLLSDDDSADLIKLLSQFNDKVAEAEEKHEPFIVSRYVIAVAQSFNKFYHNNQIVGGENSEALTNARVMLTACTRTVLKTALGLLGIAAPERM